jgi:hypothetical protein
MTDKFLGGNCFSVEIVSSRSSFQKRFKLSYCLHLPLFSLSSPLCSFLFSFFPSSYNFFFNLALSRTQSGRGERELRVTSQSLNGESITSTTTASVRIGDSCRHYPLLHNTLSHLLASTTFPKKHLQVVS